ncbi:hypothetical protein [Streptomyces sp. NPDC056361]|uniref:hypothetical protein n=1 Tax=Streptomyces sp. NPDC056361 TaxID=3345795 RepID=UPI0035DFA124
MRRDHAYRDPGRLALALAYHNLHRRQELTDLLNKRVRVLSSGLLVVTASSKTDQEGKGTPPEFLKDRPDTQLVARAKAWFEVLAKLGADGPDQPVFRALTPLGNLAPRTLAAKRGDRMKGSAINARVQLLADQAGIPYIAGQKVTAHSLCAGPNTDMTLAKAPLAERDRRGRWAPGSRTADEAYFQPEIVEETNPMDAVPIGGHRAAD